MYKKISSIDFSRLRKLEVRNLANRVIVAVGGHDPEALMIKEVFDLLESKEPQIKSLDVKYGVHPLSPELDELRNNRRAIGRMIVEQMKYHADNGLSKVGKEIEVMNRIVNKYLVGVWHKDEVTIHEKVDLFFLHLKSSEEMQTAATTLGLISYLDNLQSVNVNIERMYSQRRASISARPKGATPIIVFELKSALGFLFKQIEVAQVVHPELDYSLLIDDLNKEIANCKAKVKARASYNKKRAEQEALDNDIVNETDNDIVVETEPATTSATPSPDERMGTMQMENSTNGEVENEEVLETLDKKKTAAVSSKQSRLPDVSNKA